MATEEGTPPQRPLVFINYQTCRLRCIIFVPRLVRALMRNRVNVFDELYETPLDNIFKVIEESRIALVIFSSGYTESRCCLEQLVRIKELVEEGKLVVIPVFYKLNVTEVKYLTGKFGAKFRDLAEGISDDKLEKWKEALDFVSQRSGFVYNDSSDSKTNFIYSIVEQVKIEITRISPKQIESSHDYCLSELQEDSSMDSSISEDLKGVAREIDGILLDTKTDRDPMEADIVQPEAKSRSDDDGLNLTKDDNFLGETNSHSTDRDPLEADIFQPEAKSRSDDDGLNLTKDDNFLGETNSHSTNRDPLEADIFQPEAKSRSDDDGLNLTKDDNFLGETNSHSTVVELPPNHQILRYGFVVSHLVKIFQSYKIRSQLGMIVGCLLLLFFCLQQVAYISSPVTGEGGVIDRVVENVPKGKETEILETIVVEDKRVLAQISSEGSQKAYVDPSENTSAGSEKDKTFGIKQRMKELGDKIRSQLGMIIACLLLLFFCLQVAYLSKPLTGEGGVIDRVVENVPKVLEYIPAERTEIPRDKFPEFSIDPENLCKEICSYSPMGGKVKPPKIQVFINFRGEQLRNSFVSYLVDALRRSEINVFIDNHEQRGEDLNTLFKRIEDSGIAIVVFSSRYTESKWCLEELVKIQERVHQGLLKVLPLYFKVTPDNVKKLKGEFGDHFRDTVCMNRFDKPKIKRWKEAITFVSHRFALTYDEKSSISENDFVENAVKEVLKTLQAISTTESGQSSR